MAWKRLCNLVFFVVHVKYLDGQKSRFNFIYLRGQLASYIGGFGELSEFSSAVDCSSNSLSFNDRIVLKFERIRTPDMLHEHNHMLAQNMIYSIQVGFLKFFFQNPHSMSYLPVYSKFKKNKKLSGISTLSSTQPSPTKKTNDLNKFKPNLC